MIPNQALGINLLDLHFIWQESVSAMEMREGGTGGASDIVKAKSSTEDPRATGGRISNLSHPLVNKQSNTHTIESTKLNFDTEG